MGFGGPSLYKLDNYLKVVIYIFVFFAFFPLKTKNKRKSHKQIKLKTVNENCKQIEFVSNCTDGIILFLQISQFWSVL